MNELENGLSDLQEGPAQPQGVALNGNMVGLRAGTYGTRRAIFLGKKTEEGDYHRYLGKEE